MGTPILQRAPHWNFWHRSFIVLPDHVVLHTPFAWAKIEQKLRGLRGHNTMPTDSSAGEAGPFLASKRKSQVVFLVSSRTTTEFSWSQRVNVARPLARCATPPALDADPARDGFLARFRTTRLGTVGDLQDDLLSGMHWDWD